MRQEAGRVRQKSPIPATIRPGLGRVRRTAPLALQRLQPLNLMLLTIILICV
jgi:hypothetical protein